MPSKSSPPRRILLVEDDQDQRELVAMFLASGGHTVVAVADGAAALVEAGRQVFDVAFVDIGLPDMDGFSVARMLRSQLGDDIRLFALSGYGSPEDHARSRAAGFDAYLVKPVEAHAVEMALSSVAR